MILFVYLFVQAFTIGLDQNIHRYETHLKYYPEFLLEAHYESMITQLIVPFEKSTNLIIPFNAYHLKFDEFIIINLDKIEFKPINYSIDHKLHIAIKYQITDAIAFTNSFDLFQENLQYFLPELKKLATTNYIDFVEYKFSKKSWVWHPSYTSQMKKFQFQIGVNNISLSPRQYFFQEIEAKTEQTFFSAVSWEPYQLNKIRLHFEKTENQFAYEHQLNDKFSWRYQFINHNSIFDFEHQEISANYHLKPFSFQLNYSKTNSNSKISNETVSAQLALMNSDKMFDHSSIQLGIRYQLNFDEIKIKLENFSIRNKEFFLANDINYESEPFAECIIHNNGNDVQGQIQIVSDNNLVFYTGPQFSIKSDEVKPISIYLNFNKSLMENDLFKNETLQIYFINRNHRQLLKNETVTVYHQNYWTGNIFELRNFMELQSTHLLQSAQNLYNTALEKVNSVINNKNYDRFIVLREFLNLLGENISYLEDTDAVNNKDFVQKVSELERSKLGDCEDIAVYISAYLLSIGYHFSIVELVPNTNQDAKYAHLMLFIDSKINPENKELFDFNEYNSVVKTNRFGEKTVYIPVDVVHLNKGFPSAFKEGAKLFFNEYIQLEEKNYSFKFYDF